MAFKILLLSGPICSGKSDLTKEFEKRYGSSVRVVKTNVLLEKKISDSEKMSRDELQKAGEDLDNKDQGKWVAEALAKEIHEQGLSEGLIIVDSIRISGQAKSIRRMFGPKANTTGSRVYHIHLTAELKTLEKRYAKRPKKFREFATYEEATRNKTERNVHSLAEISDAVIKTDNIESGDVLVRASAHLDLYPRTTMPLVDVLVGGQYGSEGKGHIAAHISTDYDCLVRVGGPNAGHKVYEESQEKTDIKTFHHLPSGTMRNPTAKIILGAGAVIRLEGLREEIRFTEIEAGRLFIDKQALIIEDRDIQTEGKKLVGAISSTGQGVGAALARKILERDPNGSVRLARDIQELKPYLADTVSILEDLFQENKKVLLEGTQGTSLSLYHGLYPHVTSRDTTVSGCLAEAGISARRIRKVIMVCRTYPIRVGGPSGYMKNEISKRAISRRSHIPYDEIRKTEKTSTTNIDRRIGEFDWELLKKAVILNGPTEIALTFVDYLNIDNRKAKRFEQLDEDTIKFIEEVERVSGVPVSLISTKFDYRAIIDRRAW